MRPILAPAIASLALLAACGEDERAAPSASAGAARTELTIRVDPDGTGPATARTHRLRCPADGGPPACRRVAAIAADAFAPVPRDRICTGLFGGEQTARITGRLDGRPVTTRFSRHNGCEIARWDRAAPLLRLTGVHVR